MRSSTWKWYRVTRTIRRRFLDSFADKSRSFQILIIGTHIHSNWLTNRYKCDFCILGTSKRFNRSKSPFQNLTFKQYLLFHTWIWKSKNCWGTGPSNYILKIYFKDFSKSPWWFFVGKSHWQKVKIPFYWKFVKLCMFEKSNEFFKQNYLSWKQMKILKISIRNF